MKKRSKEYSVEKSTPYHIGWYEVRSVVGEYLTHSGVVGGYSGPVRDSELGNPWVMRYWNGAYWEFLDNGGHFYRADVAGCVFRGLARPAS